LSQCHSTHHKSHMDFYLRLNPGPQGGLPEINHLSLRTAYISYLQKTIDYTGGNCGVITEGLQQF